MPSEIIDQTQQHQSSMCLPCRKNGFCKTEAMPNDHVLSESKAISSSMLKKLYDNRNSSADYLELQWSFFTRDKKVKSSKEHQSMQQEGNFNLSNTSWRTADWTFVPDSKISADCNNIETDKVNLNEYQNEKSLFSRSLSDSFERKLRLPNSDIPFEQSLGIIDSNFEIDEPFESSEEVEAQTIGDLLPNDDDDIFSGVIGLGHKGCTSSENEVEDDIFCSGGGMELEGDYNLNSDEPTVANGLGPFTCQQRRLTGPFSDEYSCCEYPSRTLFVRDVDCSVEDAELRALFEQYGEICTFCASCKHPGFVMISYFDIRAAEHAMRAFQGKKLSPQNLDIRYSIPKDNSSDRDVNQGVLAIFRLDTYISNDDVLQKFGAYGEIKEIQEVLGKDGCKLIEFYDTRAADDAFHALAGSEIERNRMHLEFCSPPHGRKQDYPKREAENENPCSKLGAEGLDKHGNVSKAPGMCNVKGLPSGCSINFNTQGQLAPLTDAMSTFIQTSFHGASSSSNSLLSPVSVEPIGNHHTQLLQSSHSLGQVNFGIPCARPFQTHPVQDFHDRLNSNFSVNSLNEESIMPININPLSADIISHKFKVGPGAFRNQSFEHTEAGIGIPGTGGHPFNGHQFNWNNPTLIHGHSTGSAIWPNSPSFMSSLPAHAHQQMHAVHTAPSCILSPIMPQHCLHVGSAPVANPSLWERRFSYSIDPMEASGMHQGSLRPLTLSCRSPLHSPDLASQSIFPNASLNCLAPSIPSSPIGITLQHRKHLFSGKKIHYMAGSYDAAGDRFRNRRNDASASQVDNKKHFELDIDRIVCGEDPRTTLMIKNIPNKYTSKMLLAVIDENHRGTYDFIYLPIDFKNKCNVGYAFINMINPKHIIPFYQTFNGKKWEKFNSEKVASLAYARIQGKQDLVCHFQNSSLMNEDKWCRPILFHTDGPNAGDQKPFPIGTNIRSRPGRSRAVANEDSYLGSSPACTTGD